MESLRTKFSVVGKYGLMLTAADLPVNRTRVGSMVPPFEPFPGLRGAHRQTIVTRLLDIPRSRIPSVYHEVMVDGGDRVSVLESVPDGWVPGDPTALLVHGLGGCARAPYVVRVALRLWHRGVRVVRMNLRGAGSGFGLARGIYHAGRTDDLRRVAGWMAARTQGSPLGLVGFSLGANLVLKLAAEASEVPLEGLDCVLAANPPADLEVCCRHFARPENRVYSKSLLGALLQTTDRLHARFPDLEPADLRKIRSINEFDTRYTALRNGFGGTAEYYTSSSAAAFIPRIGVPGLVIHAVDDPLIPAEIFHKIVFPSHLALELIQQGGHLGYLSRRPWAGTRRWLDARFTAWLSDRWGLTLNSEPKVCVVTKCSVRRTKEVSRRLARWLRHL